MNTINFIKMSLESSRGWAMALISDMLDSPMTRPTPNGGNHPLWNLGHIIWAESNLLDEFILGNPNRFPDLGKLFAFGMTPSSDASHYPTMEELLVKYEEIRTATLSHLDTLEEADLDKPSHAPAEFGEQFGTIAGCFAAMTIHTSFHAGQVADARRAAGREPLFKAPEPVDSTQ